MSKKIAGTSKLTESQKRAIIERFFVVKLWAIDKALKIFRGGGTVPEVLIGEERGRFIQQCLRIVDSGAHSVQRMAWKILLDWYTPGWEKEAPDFHGSFVERESKEYRQWRAAVLKRDEVCTQCGSGDRLHAHHVIPWASAPAMRVEVANGLTLCAPCHGKVHGGTFGMGAAHG